jgi:hypothetical protein
MTTSYDATPTGQPRGRRALVVLESMFGNTEAAGLAIAEGLRQEGVDTRTVPVTDAAEQLPEGLDLLVLGGPTHAFSLSRPSTRADAVRQGAPASAARLGIREWLTACQIGGTTPRVAVFDTRVTKVRRLPMAAARAAGRLARRHHLRLLAAPESFLVADTKGPMAAGELERAEAWGRALGQLLIDSAVAESVSRTRGA